MRQQSEARSSQKYKKVTGCSQRPSILCIITIIIFLSIVTLHVIYIMIPIISGKVSNNPILYILLAFHFLLLIMILYDYFWILSHDPVDRVVEDQSLASGINGQNLNQCRACNRLRLNGTHHCSQCDRCTQQFDHHCKYLNNCIGSKNYQKFLRLLSVCILFFLNIIGQGVWVFIRACSEQSLRKSIIKTYWVIIGIIGASFLVFVTIAVLLGFHYHLSCCLGSTTIDYIYSKSEQKLQKKLEKKNKKKYVQSDRRLK